MAHQFKPVDHESGMLLPHDMLGWVPEGHAVRVVIGTASRLVTRGHTTFSRFRRHLFAQDGLAEDLFYRVLHVCAGAGPSASTPAP